MAKDTAPSTQEHLPIAGIQDGVVILNDGSVRAVMKVEPINFELKSEEEQNAIIYSYQAFLNSLEFPVQIIIQSKKLDLERYLVRLEDSKKNVAGDLLRIQIEDYVDFVRRLISIANIMSKRFYVVVNYSAVTGQSALGGFTSLIKKQPTGPLLYQDQFERFHSEVINRANMVANGLSHMGLRVSLLSTQQLIELFYSTYNPDIAAEERLTDIENMSSGIVTAPGMMPLDKQTAQTDQAEKPGPNNQPEQISQTIPNQTTPAQQPAANPQAPAVVSSSNPPTQPALPNQVNNQPGP